MDKVDIVLLILIIMGIFLGYKRGFLVETVNTLGLLLSLILAFLLKNNVSILLYKNLPFFSLDGIFKGISVINILIYEAIAFLLVLILSLIVVKVIKIISRLMERVLKFTIILSIPSKILGAFVGGIKWLILAFIVSYVMVSLNYNYMNNSVICNKLLNNSILTNLIDDSLIVYKEFDNLKKEFKMTKDANEFNKKALELFMKRGIITIDSVKLLHEKGKLQFDGIDSLIDSYEEV